MKRELLAKISTATVYGAIKMSMLADMEKDPSKNVELYRVYGAAGKSFAKETANGISTGISGQFVAVKTDTETGEVVEFHAGIAYLPKPAIELIAGALASADATVTSVDFAFIIGIKFDPKSATKYVYTVQPVIQPKESDRLALLRNALFPVAEGTKPALPDQTQQNPEPPASGKGHKK